MGLVPRRRDAPSPSAEMRSSLWPSISVSEYGAGFGVMHVTPESSLQKVAVGSSVDLICSLASELPVDVFTGSGLRRREVPRRTRPWISDPDGSGYGLEDWIYRALRSYLLRGNVAAEVTAVESRGRSPMPTGLDILSFDHLYPSLNEDGEVVWHSSDGRSFRRGTGLGDVVHTRINPRPGLLVGQSPITAHAATIGLSIAAQDFGTRWFADGGHPSALLTNSEVTLNEDQAASVKQKFLAALRGSREPVVFGRGWKYEALQINPDESQFLETQEYTSAECARIFGPGMPEILGYETGGTMTYANIESRMVHLLVLTMNRWFKRVERLLNVMLPTGEYALLNRDAILQTTTIERYRAHQLALADRWKTVNEVREIEDLPPVPWGDEPPQAPAPAAPDEDEDEEDDDEGESDEAPA